MLKFSQNLILRIQKQFAEKYEIVVSDEQAAAYLDSLADWFLLVSKEPPRSSRSGGSLS